MTYTVKVRGAVGSGLIAREYTCPEHGVFDALVERSYGNLAIACPAPRDNSPAECGRASELTTSAVLGRVKLGEVSRGKIEKPPTPAALDTEALADGMPLAEFKAKRRAMWADRDRAKWKAKGLT